MVLWAFIISIIALGVALMALPTVAQMVWGKPVINLSFESRMEGNQRILFCQLTNPPIENKILRMAGVYRRQIDSISVLYSIKDTNTSEIMVEDVICDIYSAHDVPKSAISLPSSIIPSRVDLVQAGLNGTARTIAPHQAKNIELPVGKYRATVIIETSENEKEFSHSFLVKKEAETITWELVTN